MSKEREIICIMCPMSCLVTVTADDRDNVICVSDNQCKEGEKYATSEYKFPGRTLTTTVLTEGGPHKLLPVRSNQPIPKGKLIEAMHSVAEVKVKPPIKIGQVIIHDIIGTGADLIASDELAT